MEYFFDTVTNKFQTININQSQSKEDQNFKRKNMSCERRLNYDQ